MKNSLLKLKQLLNSGSANTRFVLGVYIKYVKGTATPEQIKEANEEMTELLKSVGLGFLIIIPGTIFILPVVVYIAGLFGIDILPKYVNKDIKDGTHIRKLYRRGNGMYTRVRTKLKNLINR